MSAKLMNAAKQVLIAALTITIALLIGAVLIALSKNSPVEAYQTLFRGAFGSRQRISETIVKAIPLTIMALGISIAFKAQLWNIGGDGQFIFGAIFSIVIGLYSGLPAFLALPLSMLFGMLGGALWAGLAAWIKVKFGGNEVITTLMLNYVASYFLSFLVYGPMKDPEGFDFPQTPTLAADYQLPLFVENLRVHMGIFVALAVVVLMIFFWKTSLGFQIGLVGQGETISRYAGLNVHRTMVLTMMLSGALVGLAGWNEVYGVQYRLLDGLASGYGNLAVVIALLGSLHPVGVCVASFFFSALLTGGATMQRMTEVPYSVVDIIQGLVIILVITRSAFRFGWFKRLVKGGRANAR